MVSETNEAALNEEQRVNYASSYNGRWDWFCGSHTPNTPLALSTPRDWFSKQTDSTLVKNVTCMLYKDIHKKLVSALS